ncbi:aminodeoxychorismate synthase component I [Desulfolutivibrio sp.]|uniref:aminodeoxychorismate synthase component I n=1 Tax=Desulfolutivibrio sp. TaxID=2773296 RepID=UPI002F963D0A
MARLPGGGPGTGQGTAVFQSLAGDGPGWNMAFENPLAVCCALTPSDVPEMFSRVRQATQAGRWAVLAVAYEAASALDPSLAVHPPRDFPLAYAAIYAAPYTLAPEQAFAPSPGRETGSYALSPWRALVSKDRYLADLRHIRTYIRAGESYQVNYTMPFQAAFSEDSRRLFSDLLPGQAAGYAAFVDMGAHHVLCFSPELFFQRRGRDVLVRPMKGTMPRGSGPDEDAALAAKLAACPKNRAENVMIVDLLRSDLGRVAETGSVRLEKLFTVEAYPTLWQMTSEIAARLRPGIGLLEIFQALFPCGSVTGAPKVRTMQIIRALEGRPRGMYCGALGFVRPGGDCEFCVPIRTIRLDAASGRAEYWTGGGVTIDSDPEGEYAECQVKMRFLGGARGAFRLLETLLLDAGGYVLLPEHLARMRASARTLGFVFGPDAARRALEAALDGRARGRFRVRLLLEAGGRFEVQAAPLGELPRIVRLGLARRPVSSGQILLRHKTDWRVPYEQARRDRPDCDDVLLFNERGRITETTIANVAVQRGGRLVTPPLADGLLPGVFREELLRQGEIVEGSIGVDEVRAAGTVRLFNSVRGWMQAELVDITETSARES